MTTERRVPARRSSLALGATAAAGMVALTGVIGVADATPSVAPDAVDAAGTIGAPSGRTLTVIVVPRDGGSTTTTRRPPPAPAATRAPAPQAATSAS
jgi:hypothetical protein